MTLHSLFMVLCIIAYIVFFALAIYAIKKKNATPMFIALMISAFFNLMVSLTA